MLTWTKTATGYTATEFGRTYNLDRTPGGRFRMTINGTRPVGVVDLKLAPAKEAAETWNEAVKENAVNNDGLESGPDVVLGVGQADPQGWKGGDYDSQPEYDDADPILFGETSPDGLMLAKNLFAGPEPTPNDPNRQPTPDEDGDIVLEPTPLAPPEPGEAHPDDDLGEPVGEGEHRPDPTHRQGVCHRSSTTPITPLRKRNLPLLPDGRELTSWLMRA